MQADAGDPSTFGDRSSNRRLGAMEAPALSPQLRALQLQHVAHVGRQLATALPTSYDSSGTTRMPVQHGALERRLVATPPTDPGANQALLDRHRPQCGNPVRRLSSGSGRQGGQDMVATMGARTSLGGKTVGRDEDVMGRSNGNQDSCTPPSPSATLMKVAGHRQLQVQMYPRSDESARHSLLPLTSSSHYAFLLAPNARLQTALCNSRLYSFMFASPAYPSSSIGTVKPSPRRA